MTSGTAAASVTSIADAAGSERQAGAPTPHGEIDDEDLDRRIGDGAGQEQEERGRRVPEVASKRRGDHERGRDRDRTCREARVEQAPQERPFDERDRLALAGPHDRSRDRRRHRGRNQPHRLGCLVRDRVHADRRDALDRLEHEELDPVPDERDHLERSHCQREADESLRHRVEESREAERLPYVTRQDECE